MCQRNLRTWIRNPVMLASELVQYVFIGVFIGEGLVWGAQASRQA